MKKLIMDKEFLYKIKPFTHVTVDSANSNIDKYKEAPRK